MSDAAPASPSGQSSGEGDAGVSITSAAPPSIVNHVLVAGQSLGVGVSGAPPLSLTQPFGNLMFNTGVMAGGEGLESFEPLVEGDTIPGSKAVVETMSSAFANLVAELARADGASAHDLLLSVHASGAKSYAQLKKGTKPYANGMAQVAAGRDIAKRLGRPYVVRAVATVHGESDHAEKSTRYLTDMLEWQADYEKDIKSLTGQVESVPMFETQISSWTRMMKGTETSSIPGAQLGAHLASAGKVVLVGPKYHLQYSKDGVHLTSEGYRHMGEDYAKAYRRVVLEGRRWEPLRPLAVTREGAVITIKFAVPAPPLVLDTDLVADPGNYGFEYTDASASSPSITRVEVTAPDTVVVTLSAVPTADDRHLRYAFTGNRGAPSGPRTGARGNLRDSDPTRSRSRHRLYNWCIHFDEPVP
ncbi:MAG TPA: sialate O-acetylesterase [Labilithrix sp.]|nr:sialate O-acetylesterase [Labilithrix sp.]